MNQFISFVKKEFHHIFRDKRTMFILLGMPIVQIIIFGFALTNEVKNSKIVVLDQSKDATTASLIQELSASAYFEIEKPIYSNDEIEKIGHKYFFLSSTVIEPVALNTCTIEKDYGTDIKTFDEKKLLTEFASLNMHDWSGATWPPNIVHKDVWDLIGGYSIEFTPGMYSDPDFSMKLWLAGVRIFKGVSASRVYHFGSVSVKRVKQNKGYYTFVAKWGITQNTFSKYFLRRGEQYTGPLKEPSLAKTKKLNNIFKQLKAAFYREPA